jgi:hypothetical protein
MFNLLDSQIAPVKKHAAEIQETVKDEPAQVEREEVEGEVASLVKKNTEDSGVLSVIK